MEKAVPLGKGEQLALKKNLETLGGTASDLYRAVTAAMTARYKIIEAHSLEMKKPEWARRKNFLDDLKKQLAENDEQLARIDEISADMAESADLIKIRNEALKLREQKEGF